jgi:glutaminyl-tRNA synthetase
MYDFAETLIRHGEAYVDSQSADEMRAHRGTLTEPGKPSPFRIARRPRTSTCSAA